MISLDSSIIYAILIFLALIFALNYLLYKPLLAIQAERASKTTGLMEQAQGNLSHHLKLFDNYQATIKNARMEGYRLQEQSRAEAMRLRAAALADARLQAERMLDESRASIQRDIQSAKVELNREAEGIARGIAVTVLHRSA